MPAIFSRVKNWANDEILTNEDLNAEFDNILNNFDPDQMDDYSTNVAEMRVQTDPGESGSESLATTLAGELERLRFMLKDITGKTYWYESPSTTLESLFGTVSSTQLKTRITSGAVRSGSSQGIFLKPAGSGNGNSANVDGTPTNLVVVINDTEYTLSSDISLTGLTTAPSTNNTALVNDDGILDGGETKYIGEFGSELVVDNMGSEIVGEVGKYAGFKINNGSADEYFTAYVESSTKLTQITRGQFFDESDAPIPRVAIANNDTITLMKATYVFLKTDLTLTGTTNVPRWSKDAPSGPVANDYWFDMENEIWKRYDGISFVDATAVYLGVVLCDDTDCVAARSADLSKSINDKNSIKLEVVSNTEVRGTLRGERINVFGAELKYEDDVPRWDMATDLDSGISEAASTTYFLYISELGETIISDVGPADMRGLRCGLYHPSQTWRCVGHVHNDASSNLELVIAYSDESSDNYRVSSAVSANALTVKLHKAPSCPFKFADSSMAAVLPGSSFTVSSGSTLGTLDATDETLMLHVINQDNRAELALGYNKHSANDQLSTTAEGGAGAADTLEVLYSTTARSNVYARAVALLESNQTTAGTWAAAISAIHTKTDALNKTNKALITSSGSFVIPGVELYRFKGSGGGGGGGGGAGHAGASEGSAGGGGGGGAPILDQILNVIRGETLTITIGAAGTAGAAGASGDNPGGQGGDGGDTLVTKGGTVVLTFPGGVGGGGGNADANNGLNGTNSKYFNSQGGTGGSFAGSIGGGGGGGAGFWGNNDTGTGGNGGNGNADNATDGGFYAGGGGTGGPVAGTPTGGDGGDSAYASGGTGGTAAGSGNKAGAGGGGGASWGDGGNGGDGLVAGTDAAANSAAGGGGGGGRNSVTGTGFAGGAGGSGRLYAFWDVD